jgi:FkbH-like protein
MDDWRRHLATRGDAAPGITIGLAGSMTVEPLEAHLGAYLLGRGFKNPHFLIAPFNQIHQACRDPENVFGGKPDIIVILWRIEDILQGAAGDTAALLAGTEEMAASIRLLREMFSGTIVVSNPPYPSYPSFDARELGQAAAGGALHRRMLDIWDSKTGGLARVRALDLHGLMMRAGMEGAHDPRTWLLYHQPWTNAFWKDVGRQTGRIVAAETAAAKKCIVLDADNTLWGGIVGEDGVGGLELGDEFPGSGYRAFQQYILHLRGKGVLLAVASKNNPEDFNEAFDGHDAMVLKRDHVAAFEVHWESKVDSIRRIASKLNIGTDAVVFIDDSAKEIAEVRERMPEVVCIQVPEEIADLPGLLAGSDLFDLAEVTDEDRARAGMMAAEAKRQTLQETMTETEFKAALGVEMEVFGASGQHIARIAQLINKTNQFNLTTLRRPPDEVDALARSGEHLVLGMKLKDRYGDYGLVGAAILSRAGKTCVIDTLLMSCRVLGRGAEDAFLATLAKAANDMECERLEGRYVPTPKNAMVRDFYKTRGFAEDEGVWVAMPAAVPPAPEHVKVELKYVVKEEDSA